MYNTPTLTMQLAYERHSEMLSWARHRNLVRSLRLARRRRTNTANPQRSTGVAVNTLPTTLRIAQVVALARWYQVEPVCTEILADDREPVVARERALARVTSALANVRPVVAARPIAA